MSTRTESGGLKKHVREWTPQSVLNAYRRLKMPKREFLLPEVELGSIFSGIRKLDVHVPGESIQNDVMALPAFELLIFSAICKYLRPAQAFEIGTYKGLSTLVMSMNTPETARIFTLDLEPTSREQHEHGLGVGGIAPFTVGEHFIKSPFGAKVTQLYANSATFDYSAYYGKMDFVFVDADHSYRFVKADTERAFQLIRPGGVILWDDYVWNENHPECEGVARCLHELLSQKELKRIAGTRFAVYKDHESTRS